MANSAKEKFDAAVKVIHSLPKDGPFQPSYDMMLNFYSYFKQATEGKCSRPKPWAWDVVNKKKWDAWTRLEDMPREEAMVKYVEELKKTIKHFTEKGLAMKEQGDPRIVEAMPQNEEVRDFMEKLGSFYEIVDEESPIPKPPTESHQPPRPQENNIPSDNETTEGKTPLEIFDHSQVVENVLKKSEEINNILDQSEKVLQNGIDGDKEDENDDSTDTIQQLAVVNAKVQMKEKDVITMNGDHVHVAEWRPTEEARPQGENGSTASGEQTNRVGHPSLAREHRTNRNRRLMSGDHLTSETDSEEEFCDTSDQPSQDETDAMGVHPTMVNSTPIKSGISLGRQMGTRQNQQGIFSGSQGYYGTGGGGGGRDNEELPVGASSGSIETQMALALVRLQQDMNNVVERVNNLEKAQREQGRNEDQKKEKGIFHWWSFDFNRRSLFAILVWPLIVHWILLKLFHRRRHRPQK
ncbi:acyl-CoA-binding domain-containing protein 5-like isoform X8 [Ostrea edulis]|uniref:acyl-CoA-binding domain-containing protein 5-like isoform X8 n=1 Tax=Ostrea edulis TaxID=37623 RepID=UPI0024AFA107|nr:acyl-CoA-binding domain-containing protein 5-like isoform X8 [Ostrea edulis]